MVYVTGDTHIDIDIEKLNMKNFPEQKNMTRDDYVIVLGDFGLYWKNNKFYQHWRKWLTEKKFTLLWIDGNHENFKWINSFPVTKWHGGDVHQTEDNIIHLIRGNYYEIDGKYFLAAGGAQSYDRCYRQLDINWWKEELWSYDECDRLFSNLKLLKNKNIRLDYILSHTCPQGLIYPMFHINPLDDPDPTSKMLQELLNNIDSFDGWYFGHWHKDIDYGRFHCLYQKILRIL